MAKRRPHRKQANQSRPADLFTRRKRAFWVGLFGGLGVGIVTAAIVGAVLAKLELFEYDPALAVRLLIGITGGVTLVLGAIAWWRARRMDDENYMTEKCTPMPLALIEEADDVWIEGKLRCPRPVAAPHFGTKCAYFHYVEKERRGSGKNTHWVTIADNKGYAQAWLEKDEHEIELRLRKARFDYLPKQSGSTGNRRYSLTYLPRAGQASGSGVVVRLRLDDDGGEVGAPRPARGAEAHAAFGGRSRRLEKRNRRLALRPPPGSKAARRRERRLARKRRPEDTEPTIIEELTGEADAPADAGASAKRARRRYRLDPGGNVPLVVTPIGRNEWVDRAEAKEVHYGVGGAVLLYLAFAALFLSLGILAGWFRLGATGGIVLALVVGAMLLLPLLAVATYNRFVAYRVRVGSAWAQIDVDLKMRWDLVPQLVETVKGYAGHEHELLMRLTQLRAQSASTARGLIERERALGSATAELNLLVEAYPKLKANAAYKKLFEQLVALEEKIAWGRHFYNEVVREYNTLTEQFPRVLMARPLGFVGLPYWEASARERAAASVNPS